MSRMRVVEAEFRSSADVREAILRISDNQSWYPGGAARTDDVPPDVLAALQAWLSGGEFEPERLVDNLNDGAVERLITAIKKRNQRRGVSSAGI